MVMHDETRPAPRVLEEMASVLGRAFYDDPAFTYILPSQHTRLAKLTWWWSVQLVYAYRYGHVYVSRTDAGDLAGLALWLPPEHPHVGELRILRLGLYQAPLRLGTGATLRANQVGNLWMRTHKENMPDGHWYLQGIGIAPDYQGQGYGGTLLQPILTCADRHGLCCYLETTRPRNVRFYERHGFAVIRDYAIGRTGKTLWTMARMPAADRAVG